MSRPRVGLFRTHISYSNYKDSSSKSRSNGYKARVMAVSVRDRI